MTRALASPWAILIVFPAIVTVMGVFLTANAQSALRGNSTEMAKSRLHDQALLVAESIRSALEGAEPALDQLDSAVRAATADAPPEALGPIMRDLLRGRAGMSYISASFPDGTFQGAYVDDDGVIRFQISRTTADGVTEKFVYDYGPGRTLTKRAYEHSDYDPRKRAFYALAATMPGRVWTEPYAFAGTNYTGITRAVAVRTSARTPRPSETTEPSGDPKVVSDPTLHAVLTVDFDVARLSSVLDRQQIDDVRALLVGRDGVLLADPRARRAIDALRRPGEVLHFADLNDPVLEAFFAAEATQEEPNGVLYFETPRGPELAAVARVGSDRALGWRVAYLAPEASFLASLHAYSKKSWFFGGAALFLALLLSIGFARLVVRVRREAADARAIARKAQQHAQELGSYRLLSCLGKGGMGEVWRAEHRLLARQAAIKLIRNDSGEPPSSESIERFRREAQTLAALRASNTIELYDYGVTEEGTLFYVMELLDGVDFETLVDRSGPQPPGRVIHLLIQACRSLAEAHEAGLVHRDIKPANLFACRRADELDLVKVLDFGLVRAVTPENSIIASGPHDTTNSIERLRALVGTEDVTGDTLDGSQILGESGIATTTAPSGPKLTRADHVMGTPEYMAPEQATGSDVDGRADLYALGAVAFWLLTGMPVFRRQNVFQLLVAHMTEPPPDVAALCNMPLPEGLAVLITECLAKSPAERPASARELLARLRAIPLATEEEWTQSKAALWWDQHQPVKPSAAQSETLAIDVKVQVARESAIAVGE